jgi:(p)ppGpp synthase/HD superfamily hydrolase
VKGYSDVVNHALAFAAKHHDRQVRQGTRLPYLTHPANVAIILTRYGCDERTVVAGILHDLVQDSVREGHSRETLEQRVGEKFGSDVVEVLLASTYRRTDDDGIELSQEEKRSDYLDRLGAGNVSALWVAAADNVHNANTILWDLRRTVDPNSVWSRFSAGKSATLQWYRDVVSRLDEVGFTEPIVQELRAVVAELEAVA